LFWIGLAAIGLEPAGDGVFFDGWSHSFVSILAQAVIFSLCFHRLGRPVMLAICAAVLSHFLLDMPVHPRPLELYPHADLGIGPPNWQWGEAIFAWGKTRYWWLQLTTIIPLLGFYAFKGLHRKFAGNLIAASCLIVLGLHVVL
jgi:hypothetical protein